MGKAAILVSYFALLGGLVGFTGWNSCKAVQKQCNYQLDKKEVQKGYVAPAEIESIRTDDLDRDGSDETIVRIKHQNYLLKHVEGSPVLVPYRVETKVVDERQREKESALKEKVGG